VMKGRKMCYLIDPGASSGPAGPIRALHSLSPAQVAFLHSGLRRIPLAWSVDEQEGYDGDLTLVLTLEDEDTDLSLAIWRTPAGFHLCTMREDEQVACEILGSIEQVLNEIRSSGASARHLA
jgi:hypothetical protein